ncbi:L,D-transpeptidase [Viscerimonas tarda]
MKVATRCLFFSLLIFSSCTQNTQKETVPEQYVPDSLSIGVESLAPEILLTIDDIKIEKELTYEQHLLEDVYPYKDTTREFQWTKIQERLFFLDSIQLKPAKWGILRNYKNLNGEAPLVRTFIRNVYDRVADTLGVERYQSIPMFLLNDSLVAERYGRDGSLVKIISSNDSSDFVQIENTNFSGKWLVPKKYIKTLSDTVIFKNAIFVDRVNQNIASLEKLDSIWFVRSMNPATTGMHKPPYAQETPVGLFVVQEKKSKMVFLKDGSVETGGFAPWASRFTNGAYIHGIPVNVPRTEMIEFSASLGTTPRSHMCVRNATSHSKFIYDRAPTDRSVIFVFD